MAQAPMSPKSPNEERPATGSLAIQLVDCFSHQGVEGVEVCFGYKAEASSGEPAFRHNDEDYTAILTLLTDKQGWVMFKNAHLWRGEACAVCITAKGYRPASGSSRDVLTCEVEPVRADDEVVAAAFLVPEEPALAEDFSATVHGYLASLSSVRVEVPQGANFGDQSAAFALIQTLRLAGYKGGIHVLSGAAPLLDDQRIQAELTFFARDAEESSLDALQAELEARVHRAYEGRVRFHDRVHGAPPLPTFDAPHPLRGEAPPSLDELSRRLSQFKSGLLAQLKSERDRVAQVQSPPSARLRSVCEIDLSDRPSPFPLTELSALLDTLVPLGLSAYELRDSAGVREAAGLSDRAPAPRGASVLLSVELTVRTRAEVSVMDKLRMLRPDLSTASDLAGVEWLAATRFEEDVSRDATVLGVVPAGEDYSDAHLEKLQREVLRTGCVLALEPFSWFPEKRSMCLPGRRPERLCIPRAATYQLAPARPDHAGELIARLCSAARQDALIAPLTALFELSLAKKIDLMTVYGLHQPKRSPVGVVVNNLIEALVAVQARRGRPTVVLAVYKLSDLAHQVSEANAAHARYTSAAEALPHLGEVERGKVLLVHAPMLPQAVFQLFCETSALPLLLEGANTSNLAQMLGLPYLSIASTNTDYIRLAGADCPDYRWLKRCEDELNRAPEAGLDDQAPRLQHLEEYLTDTLTHGDQALKGYFARLKRHVQRPERNQVLLGLYRLATALQAKEEPPGEPAAPPRITAVGELPPPAR